MLLVSIWKESNRLEENCGMPQEMQCHETFECARASYTGVDICMHSTWYHWLQSSHATPRCFHVTGRSQIWQGYLLVGPGFNSTSEAFERRRRVRYRRDSVLLWREMHAFTSRLLCTCRMCRVFLTISPLEDKLEKPVSLGWFTCQVNFKEDETCVYKGCSFVRMMFTTEDTRMTKLIWWTYMVLHYNPNSERKKSCKAG